MNNPDVTTLKNMHQRPKIIMGILPQHLVIEIHFLLFGIIGQNRLHFVPFEGTFCTDQPAEKLRCHRPMSFPLWQVQ